MALKVNFSVFLAAKPHLDGTAKVAEALSRHPASTQSRARFRLRTDQRLGLLKLISGCPSTSSGSGSVGRVEEVNTFKKYLCVYARNILLFSEFKPESTSYQQSKSSISR
jgi:hypothetical protein